MGEHVIARWISILAHPFVMVAVMVFGVGVHIGSRADAARALLIVVALALLPIGVFMLRQVRRAAWANVDASNRSERPVLFFFAIIAVIAFVAIAMLWSPVSFVARGGVAVLAMLVICAIANRWIKISLHMMFGALAATTLLLIGSPVGWTLIPLLPALAWSRLALGRHRLAEVAAGLLLGFLTRFAIA